MEAYTSAKALHLPVPIGNHHPAGRLSPFLREDERRMRRRAQRHRQHSIHAPLAFLLIRFPIPIPALPSARSKEDPARLQQTVCCFGIPANGQTAPLLASKARPLPSSLSGPRRPYTLAFYRGPGAAFPLAGFPLRPAGKRSLTFINFMVIVNMVACQPDFKTGGKKE